MTSKAFFRMLLGNDLGVSATDLNSKVRDGKTISVRLTVIREHSGLNEGRPAVFTMVYTALINRE